MTRNVFAGLLQQPRSVLDYTAQLEDIDSSALRRRMGEAELGQMQRKNALEDAAAAQATQERNALAALINQTGGDPVKLSDALMRSGNPTFFAKGQELQKGLTEQRSKVATAAKAESETLDASLRRYRAMLDQVQTPQMAAQWMQAQYSDPQVAGVVSKMGPLEQALSTIPQDPQAFAQWRAQSALGMEKFIQEQRLGAAAADTRANQTLVPDGKGGYVPNAPLIDAKAKIAAAGASHNVTFGSPVAGQVDGQPVFIQPGNRGGPAQVVTTPDGRVVAPPPTREQTKPLPPKVVTELKDARENAAAMDALASSFKPSFAGKGVMGLGADMQVGASANLGIDKDAVDWWKNYRKQAELVERHAMFGASLTQGEQASWRSADISPGMDPAVVARNLATRQRLARKVLESTVADMSAAGYDPAKVEAIGNRPGAAEALREPVRGAPKAGTVEGGYRFKGGNPADPKNWEKV